MKLSVLASSKQLPMGTKIGIASFAVLLVMLVAGLIAREKLRDFRETVAWSNRTHQAIAEMHELVQATVEQQAALRGYLLAADPKFLEPYRNGGDAFAASLAHLRRLIAENPAQQKRLNNLQDLADTWQRDVAEEEIALIAKPETQADARRLESAGAGKAAMDGIRSVAATMQAVELESLAKRVEQAQTLEAAEAVLIIGLLSSMVVTAAVGLLLRHSIAVPTTAMVETMRRVADGEIDIDIDGIDRDDELGVMARALAALRQILVERNAECAQLAHARRLTEEVVRAFDQNSRRAAVVLEEANGELLEASRSISVVADRSGREAASSVEAFLRRADRLQTIASVAGRLAAVVTDIDLQVGHARAPARAAAEQAERAVAAVRDLAAGVLLADIGSLGVHVDQVAERTRLLAMHTRMETVKAGDAGRGFAVIADEMSDFATDAETASRDARDWLIAMRREIGTAVGAVEALAAAVDASSDCCATLDTFVETWRAEVQADVRRVKEIVEEDVKVGVAISGITRTAAADAGAAAGRLQRAVTLVAQETLALRALIERFLADAAAA